MAKRRTARPKIGDSDKAPITLTPEVVKALECVYEELKKVRDPDRRQESEGLGVYLK